jgi:hypothetical protein
MAGEVRAYSFSAYATGFTFMLMWLVAGLAAFACTRETYAKQAV